MSVLTQEDKKRNYDKLHTLMSAKGVDVIYCSGEGAVKYIAGEYYNTKWVQALFFRDSDPVMFIAGPGREYLLTSTMKYQEDYWVKDTRISSPKAIAELILERVGGTAKIGVTFSDIPVGVWAAMKEWLKDADVMDISNDFALLRRCKGGNELKLLRRSPETVDTCIRGLPEFLKPGMTENQLWGYLEGIMRAAGASGTLNQTCVDKRDISSVLPCWVHSQRPLEKGDLIAAEITCNAGGYWTQKIATISMGPAPQVVKEMNAAGNEAVLAGAAMVKPGVNARDVLRVMDEKIEAAGFLSPRQFLCGPQGHLSGLDVDEGTFELDQDFILEEGMLFVLHPGTAVKLWQPGEYGIFGPGSMYVVTKDGVESLNKTSNEVIEIDC